HMAASDAGAAATLLQVCLKSIDQLGIATFNDLADRKAYKFTTSFDRRPLDRSAADSFPRCQRFKSRAVQSPAPAKPRSALAVYWDALTTALADLIITDEEMANLRQTRERLL